MAALPPPNRVLVPSDPNTLRQRAADLAQVAGLLATEAAALALYHSGEGHDSSVAQRAAKQATEAAQLLRELAHDRAPVEATLQAATWALSAAAVAITQAKLGTPLGPAPAATTASQA